MGEIVTDTFAWTQRTGMPRSVRSDALGTHGAILPREKQVNKRAFEASRSVKAASADVCGTARTFVGGMLTSVSVAGFLAWQDQRGASALARLADYFKVPSK